VSVKIARFLPLLLLVTTTSSIFLFQNCAAVKNPTLGPEDSSLLGYNTPECLPSTDVNTCLFYKSPIVLQFALANGNQAGEVLNTHPGFVTTDTQGFLKNSDFNVQPSITQRLQSLSGNYFYNYKTDPEKIEQLMAFDQANRFSDFFFQRIGVKPFEQKNLSIITHSQFTGWSYLDKKIYLGNGQQKKYGLSVDSGSLIHFLTEALIAEVTAGRIYDPTGDIDSVDCGFYNQPVYQRKCCKTKIGCSEAVTGGLSDYMVSVFYPDFPATGETISENVLGQAICGITRNPSINLSTTVDNAFAACSGSGAPGHVSTMSAVYASIWYQVRKSLSPNNQILLDKMLFQLAGQLKGPDNFQTVLQKIQTLDNSLTQGQIYSLFLAEHQKRGL
jgi:hypothetical protein